jgi:urocanate hydratase
MDEEAVLPDWFMGLSEPDYIRPLLDVGVGRFRMAA